MILFLEKLIDNMKRSLLNIYNLHKKVIFWEKYEQNKIIYKYLKKTKYITPRQKFLLKLKQWDLLRLNSISTHTNVCRQSGRFKKVFKLIGFNRHMIRQHLNVGALPTLKKLHW